MKIDNNILNKLGNSTTSIIQILEKYNTYKKDNINKLFNYAFTNWKNNARINDLIVFAYKYGYLKDLINNKKFSNIIINSDFPLIELKSLTKKNTEIYKQIILKINNNKKLFIRQTINYSISKYFNEKDINKSMLKLIQEIIFMIIEEIAQNENEEICNLEAIGNGEFSYVYSLGNKVIKIGRKRLTQKFPNNPYIVKPLLRKAIPINDNNDIVFIEVCEKVKTNHCTKKDVYTLYKNLRDIGLIWLDPKVSNVGKLIKDNKIHWNSNLNPSNKVLMLDEYVGNAELKAGEPIICDADLIYTYSKKINVQRVAEFELKYRNEKAK